MSNMWPFLLSTLFLTLSVFACENLNPGMQRDLYAYLGLFPSVVSIRMDGRHFCAGSIVHPRWIITVAHCFQNMTEQQLARVKVVAGTLLNHGNNGTEYSVEFLTMTEYSNQNLTNDLALLRLTSNVKFSRFVQKIEIGLPVEIGTQLIAAGWGFHFHNERPKPHCPRTLRLIELVTVEKQNYCRSNIYYLCAAPLGSPTICERTSGGPLIYPETNTLVGLISMGMKGCDYGYATGFTRISTYAEWIKKVLSSP